MVHSRKAGAYVIPIFYLVFFSLVGCGEKTDFQNNDKNGVRYAVTIQPLKFILHEIVRERGSVVTLAPPGYSPALFELKPSDYKKIKDVRLLFYVDERMDGWALNLPVRKKIEVFTLLPEENKLIIPRMQGDPHKHEGTNREDPHFWSDPLMVNVLIDKIVEQLCDVDNPGCDAYRRNGAAFIEQNRILDRELKEETSNVRGKKILLFHPSMQYFMKRYEIGLAGIVEPYPGKEPSPRYLADMVKQIKQQKVYAVFSEVQLPEAPARAVSEATGLPLYELDPLGGFPGRDTYRELLFYNARILNRAHR